MKGIISLGEALIDFIPLDKENLNYQKSPGGAPANVAVGVAKLGANSAFLGKVGKDVLGDFLVETLQQHGVNTESMEQTTEARTGVVFVTLGENGERSFSFYIDPSADRFLSEEDLNESLFQENKVLHFGSISLISEPSRTATIRAVQRAKENGLIVSYDPNLRLGLWKDEHEAKQQMVSMLSQADVLKISEEELTFITGETDIEKGCKALNRYKIPITFVTLGAEGSYFFYKGDLKHVPAMKVDAVDTTGAGDAFVSGLLYSIDEQVEDINDLSIEDIEKMVKFASVSGGLAASKKGAMTALPTFEQVEKLLRK
jgi:fructokinase